MQDIKEIAMLCKSGQEIAEEQANAEIMHAEARSRMVEAKSKVKELAHEAEFEEREKECLEALAKAEQCEKRIQELQKQVDGLMSWCEFPSHLRLDTAVCKEVANPENTEIKQHQICNLDISCNISQNA